MEDKNKMREEIKHRIKEINNKLECLKELVDSEAFAPKNPELTPLAQALSDYLKNDFEFFATKEWDEKKWNEVMNTQAAELLAIAKKEICKGCTVGLDQYWKGKEDARKEAEKSYTFHYPTYGPPCFYGEVCINPFKDCINCPRTGGDIGISTTSNTARHEEDNVQ